MIPLIVIAGVLAAAATAGFVVLRRRAGDPPERFLAAEIDPDAVVQTLLTHLDQAPWRRESERDGVTVYSSGELSCPFVGFRTVTEHDAELDGLARFLAEDLLDAFSQLNDRYVGGEELRELAGPELRIVRTCFSMPFPMANREFLHLLYKKRLDADRWVIAYHSVDDPDLPPPKPGFVRCPIYPSGQRLTRLPDGRVRVEHLMVYDLAGGVSARAMNTFLRGGHVKAYRKEWRNLLQWSRQTYGGAAAETERPVQT